MISLNITLLFQAVNFFIMLFFLNTFLFKPVLQVYEERLRKMASLEESAKGTARKADDAVADYEKKLSEMRRESAEVIANSRKEGLEESARVVAAAQAEFNSRLDESRKQLSAEVETVAQTLKKDVSVFASALSTSILGRSVN
jgi:F-type H+-transporting ATPase subunit b